MRIIDRNNGYAFATVTEEFDGDSYSKITSCTIKCLFKEEGLKSFGTTYNLRSTAIKIFLCNTMQKQSPLISSFITY